MVDYSPWKNIEISDDEDDTHPNVDTNSLFEIRHYKGVHEMEEMEQERAQIAHMKNELIGRKRKLELKREAGEDVSAIESSYNADASKLAEWERVFNRKEELSPWNVDTISQEVFSKTVINSKNPRIEIAHRKNETDEEKVDRLSIFVHTNKPLLQKFGMLRKPEDSKRFLQDNQELVCEDTASYLTLWCLELAMEKKITLMEHVSHQCISMQFLLTLARQLDRDPKACVSYFFSKLARVEQTEYQQAFDMEVESLRGRIVCRAAEKLKELKAEQEKKLQEVEVTLGPGGLDPAEVFHSLPDALKKCFEDKDIPMLQKIIREMPEQVAGYHMKRCVDSGLWCPSEEDADSQAEAQNEPDGTRTGLLQYCNSS